MEPTAFVPCSEGSLESISSIATVVKRNFKLDLMRLRNIGPQLASSTGTEPQLAANIPTSNIQRPTQPDYDSILGRDTDDVFSLSAVSYPGVARCSVLFVYFMVVSWLQLVIASLWRPMSKD